MRLDGRVASCYGRAAAKRGLAGGGIGAGIAAADMGRSRRISDRAAGCARGPRGWNVVAGFRRSLPDALRPERLRPGADAGQAAWRPAELLRRRLSHARRHGAAAGRIAARARRRDHAGRIRRGGGSRRFNLSRSVSTQLPRTSGGDLSAASPALPIRFEPKPARAPRAAGRDSAWSLVPCPDTSSRRRASHDVLHS